MRSARKFMVTTASPSRIGPTAFSFSSTMTKGGKY
eukprot:Gb_23367 [translate_table: standard]